MDKNEQLVNEFMQKAQENGIFLIIFGELPGEYPFHCAHGRGGDLAATIIHAMNEEEDYAKMITHCVNFYNQQRDVLKALKRD